MTDVLMQPIMDMVKKLGIEKTAKTKAVKDPAALTNEQLASELGKMAGNMPEQIAGQEMHSKTDPMDNPENAPTGREYEKGMDGLYREDKQTEDNLDNLIQTSAPLSDPRTLDTNQDPLSRMADKIACVLEPILANADKSLAYPAMRLSESMAKTAKVSVKTLWDVLKENPGAAAVAAGGGAAIGGGLGYFAGRQRGRKKDKSEEQAIFDLGAQVGGQIAAENILGKLEAAAAGNYEEDDE